MALTYSQPQPRPTAELPRPVEPQSPPPPSTPPPAASWEGFDPKKAVVDDNGFPRVNLGVMYDTAQHGLTEQTYNNAADAGFGALRAGPYVASLNQNIGNLQGQMAGKAADLAESEAGRRLNQSMQTESLRSQEGMNSANIAGQNERNTATLAAQKLQLGMQLDSNEMLALNKLSEEGRQYDLGLGQHASEFGADLAFRQQGVENQAYNNYLGWLFGGASGQTDARGRAIPNGMAPQSSNPFGGLINAAGMGAGMYGMGQFFG